MVGKNAEKFITDMIAGGYAHTDHPRGKFFWSEKTGGWWWEWPSELEDGTPYKPNIPCCYDHIDRFKVLLLDPSAWKAVGKTRGWYDGEHVQKAQDFIYRLFAEGRSIDRAL